MLKGFHSVRLKILGRESGEICPIPRRRDNDNVSDVSPIEKQRNTL